MGAFVAEWSKEFHPKERFKEIHISYNRDRHTCINPNSKKWPWVHTYDLRKYLNTVY